MPASAGTAGARRTETSRGCWVDYTSQRLHPLTGSCGSIVVSEFFLGNLSTSIATHGLWIVALIVGLESLGLPLPGETLLITAAIFAGTTGKLSLLDIILVAAAGAIIGDSLGFWLGRSLGQRALIRYGPRVRITPDKIKLGQYLFLRHGGKVVFFGRFVAILRMLAAFLAGANGMAWPRFLLFNAAGGLLWSTGFASAAYFLGDRIHTVKGPIGIVVLIVAAVLLLVAFLLVRRREAALTAEAKRAFPGPVRPR